MSDSSKGSVILDTRDGMRFVQPLTDAVNRQITSLESVTPTGPFVCIGGVVVPFQNLRALYINSDAVHVYFPPELQAHD